MHLKRRGRGVFILSICEKVRHFIYLRGNADQWLRKHPLDRSVYIGNAVAQKNHLTQFVSSLAELRLRHDGLGVCRSRSNRIIDTHLVTKLKEFLMAPVLSPMRQRRLAPIRERRGVTGVPRKSINQGRGSPRCTLNALPIIAVR